MPTTDCGFGNNPDQLTLIGPTLGVSIGFDPDYRHRESGRPALPDNHFPALVDTGALESCIDSSIAMELGLPIVEQQQVSGAGGAYTANMFLAQMHIPALDYTIYGQFAGVHLLAGGQAHYALIGRTFLQHFVMAYNGRTGRVTISND